MLIHQNAPRAQGAVGDDLLELAGLIQRNHIPRHKKKSDYSWTDFFL